MGHTNNWKKKRSNSTEQTDKAEGFNEPKVYELYAIGVRRSVSMWRCQPCYADRTLTDLILCIGHPRANNHIRLTVYLQVGYR
jgi:hypothetical protein